MVVKINITQSGDLVKGYIILGNTVYWKFGRSAHDVSVKLLSITEKTNGN